MIECSPEDLAANRQGQLSATQRAYFERQLARARKFWIVLSVAWSGFVALGAIPNLRTHGVAGTLVLAAGFAALGIALILAVGRRVSARAQRLFENDTVECVRGRLQDYRRAEGAYCFVAFNGQRMIAPLGLIKPHRKELAEHTHHVYFLRRRGDLLSLERA